MPEYTYINDYEKEWTQKYEGTYTPEEIANAGLTEMEKWMKKIGVAMCLSELGATEDMIEGIADATIILDGGYKVLDRAEIVEILKESL